MYLVYLPLNQQYYAMKSIRKDIVIDSDSLENIKLEKLILLQVDNPFIIQMQFVYQRSYRIYFIMDYIRYAPCFFNLIKGEESFFNISGKRDASQRTV